MLNNYSVRTVIVVVVSLFFVAMDLISPLLSASLNVVFMLNIVWLLLFVSLWFYMTKYLIKPINEVKRNIDENKLRKSFNKYS